MINKLTKVFPKIKNINREDIDTTEFEKYKELFVEISEIPSKKEFSEYETGKLEEIIIRMNDIINKKKEYIINEFFESLDGITIFLKVFMCVNDMRLMEKLLNLFINILYSVDNSYLYFEKNNLLLDEFLNKVYCLAICYDIPFISQRACELLYNYFHDSYSKINNIWMKRLEDIIKNHESSVIKLYFLFILTYFSIEPEGYENSEEDIPEKAYIEEYVKYIGTTIESGMNIYEKDEREKEETIISKDHVLFLLNRILSNISPERERPVAELCSKYFSKEFFRIFIIPNIHNTINGTFALTIFSFIYNNDVKLDESILDKIETCFIIILNSLDNRAKLNVIKFYYINKNIKVPDTIMLKTYQNCLDPESVSADVRVYSFLLLLSRITEIDQRHRIEKLKDGDYITIDSFHAEFVTEALTLLSNYPLSVEESIEFIGGIEALLYMRTDMCTDILNNTFLIEQLVLYEDDIADETLRKAFNKMRFFVGNN